MSIEKILAALILVLSLITIGNSVLIYKRSFYLEAPDRINLKAVVENIEHMEHAKLVALSKRLVSISDSDFQILLLMNEHFRRAIAYLLTCLVTGLVFILYLQLKPYFKGKSIN